MRVNTAKPSPNPVPEPTHAQIRAEGTRVDIFEVREYLPHRTAELLLASARTDYGKVKKSADSNFYVTQDEANLDLSIQVRELKTRLKELEALHLKGASLPAKELWNLRHELCKLDADSSRIKVDAVADILCESSDYMLFDLADAVNNKGLNTLLFRAISDNEYANLEMLGVIEKGENGKFQISDTGFQVIKDAIALLVENP